MNSVKLRFFGRKTLLADIVQGVLAPTQPLDFSLVGPKMIGKSRLMKYLAAPDGPLLGQDENGWRPERFHDGQNIIVGHYDCDWPEAQANLLQFIFHSLRRQLEAETHLGLNWPAIEQSGSPGQQIGQVVHHLTQQGYRLILLLDNFDQVLLSNNISPDMVNELRPLTNDLSLVVATDEPLHDLNQAVAASPLFNVMHQHFVGLVEPDTAEMWIDAYREGEVAWTPAIKKMLLEMAGRHPFLLARIYDTLLEIVPVLVDCQEIDIEHAALTKLRLTEHSRPLFELSWRKLNSDNDQVALSLIKQLTHRPLPVSHALSAQAIVLNRLINKALVTYDAQGYRLFSPLFQEFLAEQLEVDPEGILDQWPATANALRPGGRQTNIYDSLAPIEADLLRYFQTNSSMVISPEKLLAEVWKQPEASPRRVQEAIRRLRNSLSKHKPPVGVIENERGVGYRYEPAHSPFE